MTTATWKAVNTRIANIVDGIDTTIMVDEYVPRRIIDDNLPLAVVVPREMTANPNVSSDRMNETRAFDIELYLVNARRDGIEFEGEETALTTGYLDTIPHEFKARKRLELNDNGLDGITDVSPVRDGGLGTLEYPRGSGTYYLGFVFRVTITRSVVVPSKRSSNP